MRIGYFWLFLFPGLCLAMKASAQTYTWERTPSQAILYEVIGEKLIEKSRSTRSDVIGVAEDSVDVWIEDGSVLREMDIHFQTPGAEQTIRFSMKIQARGAFVKQLGLEVIQPLDVSAGNPSTIGYKVRDTQPYNRSAVTLTVTGRGSCNYLALIAMDAKGTELVRKLIPWRQMFSPAGIPRPKVLPPPPNFPGISKDLLTKPIFPPKNNATPVKPPASMESDR